MLGWIESCAKVLCNETSSIPGYRFSCSKNKKKETKKVQRPVDGANIFYFTFWIFCWIISHMYLVFATVKHLYLVNILWQGLVVPHEFMGAVQCSITRQRIFSESKMLFKYRSKENYKISPVKEKFLILVHILPKQASVLSVGTLNALISTTALLTCVPFSYGISLDWRISSR